MAGEDTFDTLADAETVGDIFADIDTPQPEPAPSPEPEAPKQDQQTQQTAREDMIPSWRLREEADARRRAESQAAEFQRRLDALEKTNQKAPEIWEDPKGFVGENVKAAIDPVSKQLGEMREQFSQMMAVQRHGAEKVQAAYTAIQQGLASRDPQAMQAYQQIMAGMDPYGSLVDWHARTQVLSSVGSDLDAYNAKIKAAEREAALKDPEFLRQALAAAQSQARGNPVIVPARRAAPNLTAIPSVNRSNTAADDGDDEPVNAGDAFRQAFSSGR